MKVELEQETIVREHFKQVSTQWGGRYQGAPQRMSDLDLVLRRENVHRLLSPVIQANQAAAEEKGSGSFFRNGPEGASQKMNLTPFLQPLRVLDLGCGTGDVLEGLSRDQIRVTGVDFVPEMVAQAAREHPADRFAVADGQRLPFAAESFDAITCLGVLEYVPDPSRVLERCRQVLRSGGHLIVSFPNRGSLFRKLSGLEVGMESVAVRVVNTLRNGVRGGGRAAERIACATALKQCDAGDTLLESSGTPLAEIRRDKPGGSPAYRHAKWTVIAAERLLERAGFTVVDVRFNTYGFWGRMGRWPVNLKLCRWMSSRFMHCSMISRHLACTVVFHAIKEGTGEERRGTRDEARGMSEDLTR